MPGIDTLNEWVMILESLFKDVLSITAENQDQALLEALSMLTIVQILQEENVESSVKNLQKIRDLLFESILVSPELVSTIMLITGLYNDLSEEMIESFPQESEKYYIASLVQLFQVIGDPRGRGNFGLPIILFITQKLQLLALASKKIQDSEVAEEIFDACLQGKHKSAFNRQIQQATGEQHQKEIHDEFNILKYQERPKNVLTAGGFVKATDVYLRQSTKRKNTEIQVSDVTIKIEDDDAQRFLKELNFKAEKDEQIPFQHWMVSRQIYQQILLSLKKEKEKDQKNLLRTLIRQSINSHQPQALLQWLIHYNPTSMQSGFMWESHTVKEFVFSNTTIISQQGSSGFSNSGFSQRSGKSELQDNLHSRQKRQFLGSYTQLFGQEYGGMNRQEVQGLLYVWGTDSQGQLGVDSPGQKFLSIQNLRVLHPRLCIPLKNEILKEVCCGYSFTFALNQYSQAYCWGSNEFGQLGLGPEFLMVNQVRVPQFNPLLINVQKISAGNEHGIALLKTGDVFSWGSSNLTGLNDANHRHIPTQVNFKSIHKAAQIACGGLHTCVVMKNGEMYSWGSNEGGQLGLDARHAMLECIKTPVMVQSLQKEFIVDVACGETHTVALTKQGTVWGWGMSMYGQLGLGFSADSFEPGIGLARSKVPKPTEITPHLPPDVKIKKIICGAAFTLFQTEQGEIYGCGINDLGQLGLDTYLEQMQLAMLDRARLKNGATQTSSDVTIPSKVICFEKMNVHQVACGENHSLAVIGEDSNMLWSWGMYKQGQLGLGEINQKMNPRPVQTLCSSHVHRIAAGSMHSVALIGDEKQLGGLVHNFFLNSDLLFNPWIIDIRLLKQLNN